MDGGEPERLELRLIGGFALIRRGEATPLRNRKAQAVIAHLALSPPHRQPRDRLADALWSESGADQARQSLRQTLHDLKRALGADAGALIDARRGEVALNPAAVDLDLSRLIATVEHDERPPEDVDWAALPDGVLAGFDDLDPVFSEWIVARRAAFVARLTEALERRMQAAEGEAARAWALALAALDPAHDPACRALMESDAARGDVRAALRRYAALWDLLDADYAAEPSPETQELAVALKSIEGRPVAPAAVARPNLTICMGPFRLDGVPEDAGYLVRGFRQDLIASLTPYRDWVVIEPGEGGQAPVADGVYELEGVSYPSRSGVRINVMLKETAARRFIWGQQDIDLTLSQWFETCRTTTRRIAAALDVRIAGDRLAQQARVADVSLPLYDKLLKARDLLSRWTPEDDRRAEAIFRDILRVDPDFGRAKLGIARLMNTAHIVFPGFRRPRPGEVDAVRLAQAAADADPLDAEAQLCLGWSLAMAGRAEEATAALLAACEANPTDPRKISSAADALANCGALEDAARMAQASLDLDLGASRLNWGYRVAVMFHSGRLEEAVEAARKSDRAIPLSGGYEAAALARIGRIEDACDAWRRYAEWLRPRWRGAADPSDADMLAWFVDAPPVADPARRAAMAATLEEVVAAAGASAS